MAFIDGVTISGGEYAGSIIGLTDYCPDTYGADVWTNIGEGYRNQTGDLEWYNTDFLKQIEVTSVVDRGSAPQGGMVLAKVDITYFGEVTGRFCIKLVSEDTTSFNLLCYIEDPDGNLIGHVPRNAPSSGYAYARETQMQGARHFYLALCVNVISGKKNIGLCINSSLINASGSPWIWGERQFRGGYFDQAQIYDTYGIHGDIAPSKKKSPEFGPASEPGGYGPTTPGSGATGGSGGPGPTFDGKSDPWEDTPVKPGVLSFGLLNIYKCDTGSLINLGRELFPEITWPPSSGFSDIVEWLGNVIQAFSDSIWNKGLIDYIVSIHLVPFDVTAGNPTDIKIGPRTMLGITASPITTDVVEVDCGTLHVDEYYTSYIDYQTRARIYIPYYGMVTIKPEYWQSADLQLKYLWNVMDGSFVAQLFSTVKRHQDQCKTMIGQYSGNACVHMPLSGANYANMFASLAGGAAGIAAGAASGNVAVAATSAMNLASSTGGEMQSSNPYNASSAFYGHARPYLIIERPVSHFSERYNVEKGLPLLVEKTIGSCSGFTTAEDIILDGIPCTEAEKEKIRALFKSGVIIK